MDIKSLSAEEIRAARESLASRKSFFGGTVSTREQAAAPDYKVRTQAAPPVPKGVQSRQDKLKGAGKQTRKPATKRPRDTFDDFGDLDDYSEVPTRPCIASNVSKAGDMWGQYLAAQRKREDTQHASAVKQGHPSRSAQSRSLASESQPRIYDEREDRHDIWQSGQSIPGTESQKPLGAARGASARLPPPVGRSSHIARDTTPGAGLRASAVEQDDDLDGFIDDSGGAEDWRSELQAVTGYDPSKFAPVRDNVRMVASRTDIEREERQSKRIGRLEDVNAEEEERRLRALKEAKRDRHRSKSRKRSSKPLLLD